MAMCKECKNVVGSNEIENGICKECVAKGVVAAPKVKKNIVTKEVKRVDFGNPFSFRGRSGRLDYLVYGVLSVYGLMGLGFYIAALTGRSEIFIVSLIIMVIVGLAATVRRTRDREENIVLMLIFAMVPYLGFVIMLYLLLAPSKGNESLIETVAKSEIADISPLTSKEIIN